MKLCTFSTSTDDKARAANPKDGLFNIHLNNIFNLEKNPLIVAIFEAEC